MIISDVCKSTLIILLVLFSDMNSAEVYASCMGTKKNMTQKGSV